MEKDILVRLKGADITGGEQVVVYGVDMEVARGEVVYLVGKVGSGKTSIIRALTAENPLKRGSGEVCGFSLDGIRQRDVPKLRRRLGVVFQDFQLLTDRTVEENLDFVLRSTGCKKVEDRDKRIAEVLEAVGMTTKAHRWPHELSGGEQQRIAIARALLNRPDVILADEPTGNLDPETADGILQLLSRINRERGTAIIMVTHNPRVYEQYPGRIFVCENEECLERTPAAAE